MIGISVHIGTGQRTLKLHGNKVIVGSDPACHLVLPFDWVQPRHLIVQQDAGLARIKLGDPRAKAFINGNAIGTTSTVLMPDSVVVIPSAKGWPIKLQFTFKHMPDAVMASEAGNLPHAPDEILPDFASLSAIEPQPLFAQPPALSTPTVPPHKPPSHSSNFKVLAILVIVVLMIGGAVTFDQLRRAKHDNQFKQDMQLVSDAVTQARSLIDEKKYIQAKEVIDRARQVAGSREELANFAVSLDQLSQRPEIKLGAMGYVQMEGQWLAEQTAKAWKLARERDDPRIEQLYQQAAASLKARADLEQAHRACEEALAIMGAEPVHPHPMEHQVTLLRDDIANQQMAEKMTAQGFVLYDHKWVTPEQKFRLQQAERGLVEYKDQWMSREDAFAAEQKDKGLVLYNNKWMTPDEMKIAQGFIQFEGQWITPAHRDQIIAQRKEAQRQKEEADRQARQEAARRAEAERKRQAAIEARKSDAYTMSQEFVKNILKSPSSARFQSYSSQHVVVVYTDGWYIVKAVVDSQNGFGAMLRATYYCKLRPISGDRWEADGTFLDE